MCLQTSKGLLWQSSTTGLRNLVNVLLVYMSPLTHPHSQPALPVLCTCLRLQNYNWETHRGAVLADKIPGRSGQGRLSGSRPVWRESFGDKAAWLASWERQNKQRQGQVFASTCAACTSCLRVPSQSQRKQETQTCVRKQTST